MSDQDEYQSIPVAEARAAVQASGLLEAIEGPHYAVGDEPMMGAWWRPTFKPSEDRPHPDFGRVVVTRQGQKPREVVVSWDEYAEDLALNDPAWAEKRSQKPMTIFGAEVERHAYRVVFADVLAGLAPAKPSALHQIAEGDAPEVYLKKRDWLADLAAASTKAEVDALFGEARSAKALTDATLHEAFTRRLREVLASPKPEPDAWEPKQTPAPALGAVPSPTAVAAKSKPLTVQPPRRPQGERPLGQRRRGKR